MGVSQTPPPQHFPLHTGSRTENSEAGGGVGMVVCNDGVPIIGLTTGDIDFIKIPGAPPHSKLL